MTNVDWDPDAYLELMLAEIDGYLELQERVASATDGLEVRSALVVVPDDPADAQIEIDWVVDLPDRLDEQIVWLRNAGFEAEPLWTYKDLAVVRATRPTQPG